MAVTKDFITVGTLREVVKFERNTPTPTDSGGEEDNWVEFLTARGKLRKKSGARGLEANAVLYNSKYELITRFQTAIENELNNSGNVRIVCNNLFYTINSKTIYEERFRYYVFELNEQQI